MKKGSFERLLLDVNVLVALAWPNHQFHHVAVRVLEERNAEWATCALTQLGFIRLSSNPSVVGVTKTPQEAVALLELLVSDPRHVYLGSLPSPLGAPYLGGFSRVLGTRQVTDAYLVCLAAQSGARLLTFDYKLAGFLRFRNHIEILSD